MIKAGILTDNTNEMSFTVYISIKQGIYSE